MKPILNSGASKIPPLLSRVMAIGRRTEISQYRMGPDILSKVNNICPPGQTDTIPSGDMYSDMDVPNYKNNVKIFLIF